MLIRKAEARWKGNLKKGSGKLSVGGGAVDVPYSLKLRLEDGQSATNPEELLGAAHAGCFTMALVAQLSGAGFTPTHIHTDANVSFEETGDGFAITRIELDTSADIAGIDDATFQKFVAGAKQNCPVSKALAAIEIRVKAALEQTQRARTSMQMTAD
jgi:lipoyl-dependent peroxiredoxin